MITQTKVFELKGILEKEPKPMLIDVREVSEYRDVRVPSAIPLPLSEFSVQKVLALGAVREEPLYLICRSGSRSMQAAHILAEAGFSQLVNIVGGTISWVNSGYDTEQG